MNRRLRFLALILLSLSPFGPLVSVLANEEQGNQNNVSTDKYESPTEQTSQSNTEAKKSVTEKKNVIDDKVSSEEASEDKKAMVPSTLPPVPSEDNMIHERVRRGVGLSEIDTGMIYTPSDNVEKDRFKSGDLAINSKFSVPGTEVAYNAFLRYHIGFSITWTVPEGASAQKFIDAIDLSKTSIWLGNNELTLKRSDFKINNEGNIEYIANDDSFDLFSIIKYLWSLIFGKGTADIWTYLHLNVDKLSENFPNDLSKKQVVTVNKLVPNINNKLTSHVKFYNRNNKLSKENLLEVSTWSSYISPWNMQEASGEKNGKPDDTQIDGSLEVPETSRVLKGENYKTRSVSLPITQEIKPIDYVRVVNLFTKKVEDGVPVKIDPPIEKNKIYEKGDFVYLDRNTTYYYRGAYNDILLSPVQLSFMQKTYLKLKVKQLTQQAENQIIPIEGSISSEGKKHKYYFSIDHGEKKVLENTSKNFLELKGSIPGLNKGQHIITIGVSNEFGLTKEVSFKIDIVAGKLSLVSVPSTINFGSVKLSPTSLHLKGQKIGDLIISDTRLSTQKTEWKLSLKETNSLINKGPRLTYTNRDNKVIEINEKAQPIEHNLQNKPEKDCISDDWAAPMRGLFLNISPEVQKIGSYSGRLTWTLQDVPSSN